MSKIDLILDIDDVVRNLKSKLISCLNIYYRGEDWGEYCYHNPKIRDFFMWYRGQTFYHELYENCEPNHNFNAFIGYLSNRKDWRVSFLSSNNNTTGRKITVEFINNEFMQYKKMKIHFVDKAREKVDFVLNHYDPENVLFVDDRGDTCIDFMKRGIRVFWYTKYNNATNWLNLFPELKKIPYGWDYDFMSYVYMNFIKKRS